MNAYIDARRPMLAILIRGLSDPALAAALLMDVDHSARKRNLRAGMLEEIMARRGILDDL